MPWNPSTYNQFKNIRYQPFFDLMGMLTGDNLKNVVDIGCGTGEQTSILSEKFQMAYFMGIDSSPEMLSESKKFSNDRVNFQQKSIEAFADDDSYWDLVFSNAALQWANRHEILFPKLIGKLNRDGQFAVQMPVQNENLLNQLILEMVQEEPYEGSLNGWKRESPILSIDEYTQILFDGGLSDLQIVQKVYPIIADSPAALVDFVSSTTLVPYMDRLSESERQLFLTEFKSRIHKVFKSFPAIYAFKRLLLYGRKKQR